MSNIENRLKELNITLPEAPTPVANYVSYMQTGNLVFVSGQISKAGDVEYFGKVGRDFDVAQGIEAAKICGLNLIAQAKAACGGDLEKISQCVKLSIFVNSTDDFTNQANIANGVSDLMVEVFGEKGKHSRAAVSAVSLPLNAAVEVEAIFQVN
jgi:enamine deaminase RidA (YjgF/YER057c/UK114 family)